MANFLERIFGRNTATDSKADARQRLKFLLVHDRLDISPEKQQVLQNDLLKVISQHLDIEKDLVEVVVQRRSNENQIVAELTPVDDTEDINADLTDLDWVPEPTEKPKTTRRRTTKRKSTSERKPKTPRKTSTRKRSSKSSSTSKSEPATESPAE